MKAKNILLGAALVTVGYQVGKIVGYVQSSKIALDAIESIVPGTKKSIVKRVSDTIIDSVFKSEDDKKEEEES